MSACPLCASTDHAPSWLGTIHYQERDYEYRRCIRCDSLFCEPMPDVRTLTAMYGDEYAPSVSSSPHRVADPKSPQMVLDWLRTLPVGTFLDFGCGRGEILTHAAELGWTPVGVELDGEIARETARRTGARVVSSPQEIRTSVGSVDVVYFGDVLEHLVDVDATLNAALGLLKPSGYLAAQGPLEANTNLFTWALRLSRQIRPRRVEMAPYHVVLATSRGQKMLFDRFGLQLVDYRVHEASWPAPSGLGWGDLGNPRAVTLFALRRISQALTSRRGLEWGNRFFFVGRKPS